MDFWINIGLGFLLGLYAGNKEFRDTVNNWIRKLNQKQTTRSKR